jgi:NADPH:quinone reductase-like Zn-dependent oxidoreductase
MRALQIDGAQGLEELEVRELPQPAPAEGQALVEVAAAAVNRSDLLNVLGMMPITQYPRVPGRDFAGTVLEGPEDLVGTSVWGTGGNELGFGHDGTHAELLTVPVGALVPLPSTLSLEQAGAAGLSYQIANDGLTKAGLGPGAGPQKVLVTGAAGGVGAAVASLAAWRGAEIFAAVLDETERDAVLAAHPAATVAVTAEQELSQVVAEASGGAGVDVIFDTVGNPLFEEAIKCLAIGGRMIVITAAPGITVPKAGAAYAAVAAGARGRVLLSPGAGGG